MKPITPTSFIRLIPLLCLLSAAQAARAATPVAIYDIRAGDARLGVSSVSRASLTGSHAGSASTELPHALVQHDRLWLDAQGWPERYRLNADVQGHPVEIDVRRNDAELVETVTQNGMRRMQQYPSPAPVDFLDNNSLDGLQALLDRLHGEPTAGTQLRVFVPQAQGFGKLSFDSVRQAHETLDGTRLAVRDIRARLTVAGNTVPLTLWLNPVDGRLLRFAQPQRQVTMTLRHAAQPPATTPDLPSRLAQQQHCLTSRRLLVRSGSINLIGELTVPQQGTGPWPAILLVPDRGDIDLNGDGPSLAVANGTYKQLAYALACKGIAVLRYNKQGVSPSGGRLAASTVRIEAVNIASLLSALARQPGIDPQRLALAGHAEGGLVALYALSGLNPKPAGLLLLDTPGKPLGDVLTEHLLAPARALGAAASQIRSLRQSAAQALTAVRDSHGQQLTLSGTLATNPLARRLASAAGLLRSELPLDPTQLAATVKIPMLIVQGGKDLQVPPDNAGRLKQADENAQRIDFADMTHTLVSSPLPPLSAEFGAPDSLIEPRLAPEIAQWIGHYTAHH